MAKGTVLLAQFSKAAFVAAKFLNQSKILQVITQERKLAIITANSKIYFT